MIISIITIELFKTNFKMSMSDLNNSLMNTGYLEIICGPMFSGKTTRLLEIYKQTTYSNIPSVIINHSSDTRYSNTMLSTHDKKMVECIFTNKLFDLTPQLQTVNNADNFRIYTTKLNKIKQAKVILINEGQFFEDLFDWVIMMVEVYKKKVYICGLDGDFKRNEFGSLLKLIPYCDKVEKLHSFCTICKNGKRALFSCRVTDETEQCVVGSDNYTPLCRSCYLENMKMKEVEKSWMKLKEV